MGRIADADIAWVREHADLEEIVSRDVTLKASAGRLKGLCPFHDERTPSFHVRPDAGLYHCFGCGAGGDAISYVQETQHTTFVEAVTWLADQLGYELTIDDSGPEATGPAVPRARMLAANQAAAAFWTGRLFSDAGGPGQAFLAERGFTADDARTFGLGLAPTGWQDTLDHLRSRGFTDAELVAAGLAASGNRGPYDPFHGRLIFPIANSGGDIIGFGGRLLQETSDRSAPKYVNTAETTLYKKSAVLYGIDRAIRPVREHSEVTVVEGYTDVMACHLAGITTAVATCGTAFGPSHASILRRAVGTSGRAIFVFDGDDAGRKAAIRAHSLDDVFGASTYAAVPPDGLDPCEVRQRHGDGALVDLVADPQPLLALVLDAATDGVDTTSPESQAAAVQAAGAILGAIPSRVLREQYCRKVAFKVGLDIDLVRGAAAGHPVLATAPSPTASGTAGGPSNPAPSVPTPGRDDPQLAAERATIATYLTHQADVEDLWRQLIRPEDFQHPAYARLAVDPTDSDPVCDQLRREFLLTPRTHQPDPRQVVAEAADIFRAFIDEVCQRHLTAAAATRAGLAPDDPRYSELGEQISAAYARMDLAATLADQLEQTTTATR